MISTAILIIVLSIFNGFEALIHAHINAFNVDLKISPTIGKTFVPSKEFLSYISNNKDIRYSKIIEEQVLLKNATRQKPVILKGVEHSYLKMLPLDSFVYAGDVLLNRENNLFAIVGFGVARDLGINPYALDGIEIYTIDKNKTPSLSIHRALKKRRIYASSIIHGESSFTDKYILVPFEFAKELIQLKKGEVSSIEIQLKNKKSIIKIKQHLQNILGGGFEITTKLESNKSVYKMLKTEKASIYSILFFVLIIFTFNMLASLSMLIIDKKKDIHVLMCMGADLSLIRKIFWLEGVLIIFFGLIAGLLIGLFICWLQYDYGIIQMKSTNYFTEYYPIKVKIIDILSVFFLTQ